MIRWKKGLEDQEYARGNVLLCGCLQPKIAPTQIDSVRSDRLQTVQYIVEIVATYEQTFDPRVLA
jgi:hypothetical protein